MHIIFEANEQFGKIKELIHLADEKNNDYDENGGIEHSASAAHLGGKFNIRRKAENQRCA
ncbi:hypothetical protein AGMMS49983_03060 [Clostridia bacterium]|nr:hypothetical protein AGMMS49983_03060 [Clostridia bacterium]